GAAPRATYGACSAALRGCCPACRVTCCAQARTSRRFAMRRAATRSSSHPSRRRDLGLLAAIGPEVQDQASWSADERLRGDDKRGETLLGVGEEHARLRVRVQLVVDAGVA